MDPWLRHSYQIWNNLIKEHLAGSPNPLAFQCCDIVVTAPTTGYLQI